MTWLARTRPTSKRLLCAKSLAPFFAHTRIVVQAVIRPHALMLGQPSALLKSKPARGHDCSDEDLERLTETRSGYCSMERLGVGVLLVPKSRDARDFV